MSLEEELRRVLAAAVEREAEEVPRDSARLRAMTTHHRQSDSADLIRADRDARWPWSSMRASRIAPDLVLVEIANTAWRREQRGEISPDHATAIVEAAPRFFTRLVPASTLLEPALAVARVLGHPVYDCPYLALADDEQARLVTADVRLVQRVAGSRWARRVRPLVR